MSSHSDLAKIARDAARIYDATDVVVACATVEAAMVGSESPSRRGKTAQSRMQSRMIAAVVSLTDRTIAQAGQIFGLDEVQALNRRRWFLDECTEQYQRAYLAQVQMKLEAARDAAE